MSEPMRPDELLLRYREACARDQRRPASAVRDAVHAHATMLISARQKDSSAISPPIPRTQAAANQSRWKLSLLASLALVGITSLLVLQFERGTPEEQELALGRPHTNSRLPDPASVTGQSSGSINDTSGSGGSRDSRLPTLPQDQGNRVMAPNHLPARSESLNSATNRPAPAAAPPRAAIAEDSRDAAAPGLAVKPLSEALLPQDKPSTISAPPSPAVAEHVPAPAAPAPALAAPAVRSVQRADVAPAPAKAMGGIETNGVLTTSANTAQRAAKALAAPETVDAAGPKLETPALQMKRSEQRADKDASGANALRARLLDSARSGQLAELEQLLQQGALINSTDAAGRTALILAAMNGHTATVARLLALGANRAQTDHDGLSALQHARQLGLTQIVRLLEAGP